MDITNIEILKELSKAAAPPVPVEVILLSRAVLCEDCRCITTSKNSTCVHCGGGAVFNLENLLNGG